MHIHALRLSISEQELNEFLAALPADKNSIQNLRVRLTPEGIQVLGEYSLMFARMAFETLWEVQGIGNIVEARLVSVKAMGLPATMLRSVLMKTLHHWLAQEPGMGIEAESIRIDLSKHTALQKLHLGIHLTAVQCSLGKLVIEAGSPPALVNSQLQANRESSVSSSTDS